MSARRSVAERFTVTYGMNPPDGYSWSHGTHIGSNVVHLQNVAEIERDGSPYLAACGRGCAGGGVEWISGRLCRECARAAGVTDVADLTVDAETDEWMRAQHGEPAPSRVERLLDSLDESVAAARAAKQERNDFAERAALELIESADRMLEAEAAEWPHVVLVLDPEVAASVHGGLGECVTGARGPYPNAAEAWIAATAVRDDLAQHDAEPWIVVAVPLMSPAGEPWRRFAAGATLDRIETVQLWAQS